MFTRVLRLKIADCVRAYGIRTRKISEDLLVSADSRAALLKARDCMFTGLIEGIGTLQRTDRLGAGCVDGNSRRFPDGERSPGAEYLG